MVPVFVILLGLVYDGGDAYIAHTRALNLAEQAARAGAQEIDLVSVRAGGPYRLDRAARSQPPTGSWPRQASEAVGPRSSPTRPPGWTQSG
jgi:hypothetical protein